MEKEQTKKATNRGRHLTAAQSAEAVSLWAAGNVTLEQLCERYKKDKSTLIRLFNKAGVAKGEKAEEQGKKIAQEIEKETVDDAAKFVKRVRETKENTYNLAAAIERSLAATYLEIRKGAPAASKAGDVRVYLDMLKGLRLSQEQRYIVLGIVDGEKGDDDDIPDLNVNELTAEQIKASQQASMEESKQSDFDVAGDDMDIDLSDDEPEDDLEGLH